MENSTGYDRYIKTEPTMYNNDADDADYIRELPDYDDYPTCRRCGGTGSIRGTLYSPPEECECMDHEDPEIRGQVVENGGVWHVRVTVDGVMDAEVAYDSEREAHEDMPNVVADTIDEYRG